MLNKLPTKGLLRLNVVISFLFSALVTIILLALNYSGNILFRSLQALLFINLVSFGNMWLFLRTASLVKKKSKMQEFRFHLYSYIWALIAWFLIISLYSVVTGKDWEGERGTAAAYLLAVLAVFFLNTIILLIQNLVIFQYRNAQHEIEKFQLEANVSKATNLLLRQQIQPHFLFNALTTVKSLYKADNKLGEAYLVHLANFLRVSVSNPKKHMALVKDEIAFCLNYLKMQKIRFGSAIEYEIIVREDLLENGFIPYFSLQPLIENALKHNELTEEKPIRIRIFEKDRYLIVQNNLQENPNREESAGNGLYNLSERYRLLGEEEIKITSDDGFFTVHLKILNNESSNY